MKRGNNNEQKDNANFELELFSALKYYGLLFPNNTDDVERFETLYGDTSIPMPGNLEKLDFKGKFKLPSLKNLDINSGLNIAAFQSDENNSLDFLNSDLSTPEADSSSPDGE